MILESKKIKFEKVDVAADETAKAKMREIAGNPKAIPPQLCNGDQYCGVRHTWIVTFLAMRDMCDFRLQ